MLHGCTSVLLPMQSEPLFAGGGFVHEWLRDCLVNELLRERMEWHAVFTWVPFSQDTEH